MYAVGHDGTLYNSETGATFSHHQRIRRDGTAIHWIENPNGKVLCSIPIADYWHVTMYNVE